MTSAENDSVNQDRGNDEAGESGAADRAWLIETTSRLHALQRALRAGRVHFLQSDSDIVEEVLKVNLAPGELIDPSVLSSKAMEIVRTAPMAMLQQPGVDKNEQTPIDRAEGQVELFRHFAKVFAAITGKAYSAFPSEDELAAAVRKRATAATREMTRAYQQAREGLCGFYDEHARTLWSQAKELGGLKLVLGGQRVFGPSAFAGVRRMALYADTQLIADPIYPFFEDGLELKTHHVELIRQLYQILQLTPLVEARLPVPPVLIFPSFEKSLEASDIYTQVGIQDLVLKTLGRAYGATFFDTDELIERIKADTSLFIGCVMREQLFLPPGVLPGEITDPNDAVSRYLKEIAESREPASVEKMASLPREAIMFAGISERLAHQYHLIENAGELTAQPMLTQLTHWHYFEKASAAAAHDLHRSDVLSAEGLTALRALQNTRLRWLDGIPVPALVELLSNQENLAFRKELAEHTKILSAASPGDLDRTVREVCHAIEVMIQRHQKTLRDIEEKYAPRYKATWITGGAGIGLGVGAMFLPLLSAFGPAAPLAAGAAVLGKLTVEKVNKTAEIRRARSSLLGVLAHAQKS